MSESDKLRELGNRKYYPSKVKQLHIKLLEQKEFWSNKKPTTELVNLSHKLADVQKDLTFIESQLSQSTFNKERIDTLMEKYGLGNGKRREIY